MMVSVVCLIAWLLLASLQLQLVPVLRYGWGFNFWAYLPLPAALALAVASLSVCLPMVREGIARGVSNVARFIASWPPRPRQLAGLGVCFLLFWVLRERELMGDSKLFLLAGGRGSLFLFPDIGATFLLQGAFHTARFFSLPRVPAVQLVSCLAGVVAVFFLLRMARDLAPRQERGAAVAALVLSGGLVRVFFGHVEVYAALLAGVAAYLAMALGVLAGRRDWRVACLALGVAVWMHLAALWLLPSLVACLLLSSRHLPARVRAWRCLSGLALSAVPSLLFLVGVALLGGVSDLAHGLDRALQILGQDPDPDAKRWWVRGWGGDPSIGTDVVFLSAAQLKYLVNAFYVLAPASLPVLLFAAARGPRRLVEEPVACFLAVACVPLVLYAFLLRPFWGPYDWDLFSISALCLATLSAHLLSHQLRRHVFRHVVTWLIAFQLCFVSVPFVVIGLGRVHPAGPFVPGSFRLELGLPRTPPPEAIAPWL